MHGATGSMLSTVADELIYPVTDGLKNPRGLKCFCVYRGKCCCGYFQSGTCVLRLCLCVCACQ